MTRKPTNGGASPLRDAKASVHDAIGKLLGDDAACDVAGAETRAAKGAAVPKKSPRT